jgi:superfamily II DNA or RNA helicase
MIKKRNEEFNYRCGLIKLTTWKWKSHVIMDIVNYYQTPTLVLVHNIKTLWEMRVKFKEFSNITPAVYGWWKYEIWNITIMTKKSFCLDYDKISQKFWLVLIDEAPVQFSKILWSAINIYFNNQKWIALYGLSGTPKKLLLDQEDLEKYFGRIIEVKWQENNWYNYIPKIIMYDYKYSWFYRYENPQEMRWAISENMERLEEQVSVCDELLCNSNCLLILTDRKIEVDNLINWFNETMLLNSIDFSFNMTWDTKEEDDNKNIKHAEKLIKSWWKVVIVGTIQKCWIWVDIPFIDSVFLASAIKFSSTVIQAIWRWLRIYEWKKEVVVAIWNDIPILQAQKLEKIKTLQTEYWIEKKDIEFITIK